MTARQADLLVGLIGPNTYPATVGPEDRWAIRAVLAEREVLLTVCRYAAEHCTECGGRGELNEVEHVYPGRLRAHPYPCPVCKPIRDAILTATEEVS